DVETSFGNFLQILGALFADGHFFRLLDLQIADVFDGMSEFLDGRLQAGAAQRGRAHVHPAAALAEVHGDADDANLLRHNSTYSTNLQSASLCKQTWLTPECCNSKKTNSGLKAGSLNDAYLITRRSLWCNPSTAGPGELARASGAPPVG